MIVQIKELSNVLSQISDLVADAKVVPGILFNIKDEHIEVCYTDGNKVFSEKIPAEIGEGDVKGKIVFNYQALTRIIEACKPTGKIITDVVNLEFCENNTIKATTEKRIPVIVGEDTIEEKVVSVTEQMISWVGADSGLKVAVLNRGNYDLLFHYSDEEIDELYADDTEGKKARPFNNEQWESDSDVWDINELRSILSRLSIESGKIVYIAPSSQKAFVQNTSCVICIPVESEIRYKLIQSSSMAKSMASVLGKIETEDGKIHTHMLDDDTVVFSTEENNVAMSIRNIKQDNSNIAQVNNCLAKDFSRYMLTFNKEVLQSCLYGAKTAGASEKIQLTFEVGESDDGAKVAKLLMSAKNTNSSTANKYDVVAEYVADLGEQLGDLKLNVTLDVVYQAVSRAETDYIAFDVSVDDNGSKMIRVAEIDMNKRAEINEANGISGGWTTEFMVEHRAEMLGYTTYFAASND